jgi:hypothetical protein
MLNRSDRPTQFGHFSHMDPPYQQWGYQLTEMPSMMWPILHGFLLRFYSRMFIPYSTNGVSVKHKMISQISHLILCTSFYGLGLLSRFSAKNFHLPFYHSFRYVHALSQFLLHIFLLPPRKSDLRYLYSCIRDARRVKKLTVLLIKAYHSYQFHEKRYPTLLSQG